MKSTTWPMIMLTLLLVCPEQPALGATIEGEINSQDGKPFISLISWALGTNHIYPGDYTVKLLVGNDNLGCSLRVGTKSSNTRLLTISGPLAVRNVTNPQHFLVNVGRKLMGKSSFRSLPFKCGTAGTIRVSNPPTVTVPVLVTLTYGPFLKKTYHLMVTQKIGIKSVSVKSSSNRSYHRLNQRVGMHLIPTRKRFKGEGYPDVYFRVREGKLCKFIPRYDLSGYYGDFSYEPSDGWTRLHEMNDFFREGKPHTHYANLCHRGRTVVEFGFPAEKITYRRERMMVDSRIKRLVFTVPQQGVPKRRIRSRGIDGSPPLVIPDPIPPALPNFELQRDSAQMNE